MHSYTTEETSKNKIIFLIAVVSSTIAPALSIWITPFLKNISEKIMIPEIATYSISGASLFCILCFLCIKILWKVPIINLFFSTPNFEGTWDCKGEGKKYNSDITNNWESEIIIEQDLEKISVFQKNKQGISISSSISANVRKVTKSTYELSYMYSNIPQQQDDTLHIHTGVAIITFDLKHKTADGIYYTDINRKSYGTMKLIRQ